jgi:hypothetical protein
MTDMHRTERDVDAAIDRAVREIMRAEPRPGFSLRVLRRLTDVPAPRWTWSRLGTAAAAAALALFAMFWSITPQRSLDTTVARQEPAASAPPQQPPPERPRDPVVLPQVENQIAPRRTRIDFRQPPPGRVEAASILPEDAPEAGRLQVRPLDAIEPIHIAPVQLQALGVSEVVVRGLVIDRITIPPLSRPQ